jgi:hypothetical protein
VIGKEVGLNANSITIAPVVLIRAGAFWRAGVLVLQAMRSISEEARVASKG